MTATARPVALILVGALGFGSTVGGCGATFYTPQVVARGELTLRYDHGFELVAGGQRVAKGLSYRGLTDYVRCVPMAEQHARSAQRNGSAAITLSVLGALIGVSGLTGLVGIWDEPNRYSWVGGGIGLGALGATLALLSWRYKNHANGHAVDAMNYYNDAVGSLGATCADLRYPAPAGPLPGAPDGSPGPELPPELPPPPAVPAP
ncbi:MAG: hypothetical protein U1A78_26710 [Polyangia bacterium]